MTNNSFKLGAPSFETLRFFLRNKLLFRILLALLAGFSLPALLERASIIPVVWHIDYASWAFAWVVVFYLVIWGVSLMLLFFRRLYVGERFEDAVVCLKAFLMYFVLVYVVPILLVQLVGLIFDYFATSSSQDRLFETYVAAASFWCGIYATFLFIHHLRRLYLRANRQKAILKRKNMEIRSELLKTLYAEDITHSFMLIRKGDSGYRLKNNGMLVKDQRRAKEIKEMLDFGYIEVSKGVHINKKDILKLADSNNRVYLKEEKMMVFESMLIKKPELRSWHEVIKSEHGLLYWSPSMVKKANL